MGVSSTTQWPSPSCHSARHFRSGGGDQAEREKDFGEDFAVGDFGFGFDAMLVAIFAGSGIGQAFVVTVQRPA